MLQLDPRLIADLVGKDLIAFGTGGIGKIVIPYLAQEPDIKLHGVTNSRVTTVDAGTYLDTRLPIRSLDTWAKLMPDATILLCVIRKNEASAWAACEAAGFKKTIIVPIPLIEMLQDIYDPGRRPTAHPTLHMMCLANELRDIHKASFAEFKGCHRGQTVAVVATGPTLNYYTQVEGIPHIGVNESFLNSKLSLDYYFLGHYVSEWCCRLKDYNFIKFILRNEWICSSNINDRFPEYIIEENHARRYFSGEPLNKLYTDITAYPLMGSHSIIFHAIQFAIFTRPKYILLIGCDCSNNGHFDGTPLEVDTRVTVVERMLREWEKGYQEIKIFVDQFYPDLEIISINPVRLKGMFHDMYTESYLEEHPEINRAECEIFISKDFEENC